MTNLRIVELKSENYKRIQAVEIHPDENFQIIGGLNGQGKSSVLDAIWTGIKGYAAMKDTDKPIRDGEEQATIELDLGDLIVKRVIKEDSKKSTLTVSNKDGAKYSSPQAMLDNLVGMLSFDPSAFANMESKKQKEALQELVGLDFTELNMERQQAYDKRTGINQEVKRLDAHLKMFNAPSPETPDEEVSATSVLAEIKAAQEVIEKNKGYRKYVDDTLDALCKEETELEGVKNKIIELQAQEEALTAKIMATTDTYEKGKDYVDALVDPEIAPLEEKLNNLEELNKTVRTKKQHQEATTARDTQVLAAEMLTGQIMEIDEQKETALREAKFPIEGLSFDEDGILFNGIPFKQCCTTERLKTSVAMAMAMNPTLRIIRIMDGSLLDKNNLAMIEQMAKDADYQVWVERVDDTGTMGIQIEDGQVKE